MKTTVIIPNFNGMKFLPDCIEALEKQSAKDFAVLVVDNGSSDGSVEWLKAREVPHIALPENLGFDGGVNVGIRATDTEYVLLLNNDTIPEPDFVRELEAAIEKSPEIFAVSAMMIIASDHRQIDSAGDGYSILGWAYQRGAYEPVTEYGEPRTVFSACAGAAIYRREILDSIGLFDEMHFAYLEDIDICYRARIAGYRSEYCPTARVYHLGSATSGSKYNAFKVRLSSRNNIYLIYKNQPLPQRILNFLPLLLGTVLKGAFYAKLGYFKEYREGIKEGLATRSKCRRAPKAARGLATYLSIEWDLIRGMWEYTKGYLKRHR